LRQEWKLYAHRSQLPPGPKTIRTGIKKPWLWFEELSKEYGDVVYLQMGPTPTIILGSAQAAWDLLEKRGSIYSSRPRFIMGSELLSNGLRGLMAPYSPFWRRWRKLLHSGFMQRQSETYRPIQSLESKVLMWDLLRNPGEFRMHLERYAASVIVTVTYGRRVKDVRSDEVVKQNTEAMGRLTQVKYVQVGEGGVRWGVGELADSFV
jgi:cytochrome P450